MPLGPYSNWKECLADQKKKGHSEESAAKICGAIEKKSKGELEKFMKEKLGVKEKDA